jgi:hypothetical protein
MATKYKPQPGTLAGVYQGCFRGDDVGCRKSVRRCEDQKKRRIPRSGDHYWVEEEAEVPVAESGGVLSFAAWMMSILVLVAGRPD